MSIETLRSKIIAAKVAGFVPSPIIAESSKEVTLTIQEAGDILHQYEVNVQRLRLLEDEFNAIPRNVSKA